MSLEREHAREDQSPEDRIKALEQKIAKLEKSMSDHEDRIAAFERMEVDEASGGGTIVVSGKNVTLRINSLTPDDSQLG